ncbi:hypothetical protein BS47DRAFT_1369431 [Hydnum rufescens UP504]|uniref:Uncharacterized protein n=1 Tax=Hydnum rufescens UP504 TaxID=1448309 RepID=A0A9P6DMI2_9AGAM|nr:hypothetical protein BS47DRAFT_1369431 [Hydnum rufescens UP504]
MPKEQVGLLFWHHHPPRNKKKYLILPHPPKRVWQASFYRSRIVKSWVLGGSCKKKTHLTVPHTCPGGCVALALTSEEKRDSQLDCTKAACAKQNWATSMHCNWPKIEYLGGMYLLSIYMRLALPLIGRSFDPGKSWTQPQDPEELEEDHTPAAVGLRFLPPTNLHNDDPNPDGCLEINASPLHENPPDEKTWSPLRNTDVYGRPNPESRLRDVTMAPKPMQRRIDMAPHLLQWVWCYLPPKIAAKGPTPERNPARHIATEDHAQGANSQMPAMDTMTGKAWHHTAVAACASTKIHPTGTWMKPPAHNTDVRSCRRSCLRVRPLNQQQPMQRRTMGYHTPAPAGHPCPQQNPTQQEHGQSPNRKYGHVQPLKISPDQVEL